MKQTKAILTFLLLVVLLTFYSCKKDTVVTTGAMNGIVSDSQTSSPIKGATVVLSPDGSTVITEDDGYFEFNDLEAIQHTITVQKTGYSTNRKTITIVAGKNTEANIPLTEL